MVPPKVGITLLFFAKMNVPAFHSNILAREGKVEFWNVRGGGVIDIVFFFKSQGGALRIQGGQMPPPPLNETLYHWNLRTFASN